MRVDSETEMIPHRLTQEEFTDRIKNWKESTTTSEFHLGYSKALIAEHDIDPKKEPEKYAALEAKRAKLIDWQVRLINLAIENRYVYERWKTIVNFMILKEPQNYKINRLRVIHLYEFDFTLLMSIKWRHLIHQGIDKGNLDDGQFGGLPGRDATTPTFIEELQYDICRASRKPLIHFDYDATACYDRIIPNLASLLGIEDPTWTQ